MPVASIRRRVELLSNRHRQGDLTVVEEIRADLHWAESINQGFARALLKKTLALAIRDQGQVREALDLARQAANELGLLREPGDQAEALRICASCYVLLRDREACLQALDQALALATRYQLGEERVEATIARIFSLIELQDHEADLDQLLTQYTLYREMLSLDRQITLLNNLASSLCQVGRYREALDFAEEGLRLLGPNSAHKVKAFLFNNRATARSADAPFEEAWRLAVQAESLFELSDRPLYIPVPTMELGAAYVKQGRYEEAKICLEHSKMLSLVIQGCPAIHRIVELLIETYESLYLNELADLERTFLATFEKIEGGKE